MSSQQPKTFFRKLKETCKKIDNDVNETKKKLYEVPDNSSDLAVKGVLDIQDKMKKLKAECNELKFKLEPKLSSTADFIQHFRELIDETEVSVANVENYLKQYGYNPLNTASPTSPEKNDISTIKEECHQEIELSKTPNLYDYGIVSHQYSSPAPVPVSQLNFSRDRKSSFENLAIPRMVELKNLAKEKENSDSTPTLEIDVIPHTENETPPMPESLPSVCVAQFPATPTLEL